MYGFPKKTMTRFMKPTTVSRSKIKNQCFLNSHRNTVYDIYNDDDYAGADRSRPEFNRLITDAREGKFGIILCKTQARFTREMELVEKYIHGLFPIWGIRFVGMVDGADTLVKGNKKARQINGLVNQWYLENLSDNIKATLKLKRIRGKYTGSVLPYGYRPDPDDINCFIIDPVAASVVRRIWEMHAGGIGAPTIARTLNEEGIPNPTSYAKLTGYSWHNRPSSSLWSAGCIYSILHNETYLGTLCQGRQLTPEGQFHSKKNIPKDQWVRTVGHHPAIIDDELLRRELKARKEAGAHNLHEQKKNFPPGIFGKEVRCASCGKILTKGKTLRRLADHDRRVAGNNPRESRAKRAEQSAKKAAGYGFGTAEAANTSISSGVSEAIKQLNKDDKNR